MDEETLPPEDKKEDVCPLFLILGLRITLPHLQLVPIPGQITLYHGSQQGLKIEAGLDDSPCLDKKAIKRKRKKNFSIQTTGTAATPVSFAKELLKRFPGA